MCPAALKPPCWPASRGWCEPLSGPTLDTAEARITAASSSAPNLWAGGVEEDLMLSMVQWSALTRVLREPLSNALAHGRASHSTPEPAQRIGCQRVERSIVEGTGRRPSALWDAGGGGLLDTPECDSLDFR